jgi:gliding motility-associated-like protein
MMDTEGNPADDVLFKVEAPGVNLFITKDGLCIQTLTFSTDSNSTMQRVPLTSDDLKENIQEPVMEWERIDVILKGANIKKSNIIKEGRSDADYNFFYPHCNEGLYGVRQYESITIKDVYPGIDWVFYNSDKYGFKYDFIVKPGSDYSQIELLYRSKLPISINNQGDIELSTRQGDIKENAPVSFIGEDIIKTKFIQNYQKVFSINEDSGYETSISFKLEAFSSSNLPLRIDPQLVWGTMIGGNGNDMILSMDTDNNQNLYVVGATLSTNYPTINLAGAYFQGAVVGSQDLMILKFDNAGILLWSTMYGGTSVDIGQDLVCDNNDNVFIGGMTKSVDFPVQDAGTFFQGTIASTGGFNDDMILLKFNSAGVRQWATYYGGTVREAAYNVFCDTNGDLLVAGWSDSPNLNTLDNGGFFQGTLGNTPTTPDGALLRFDNNGNLLWSTYYGGSGFDICSAITTDASGNIFVAGYTQSANLNTLDAGTFFQGALSGSNDLFVLKFDNSNNLLWSTYYGGDNLEWPHKIECDNADNLFIAGYTQSSGTTFPTLNSGTYYDGNNGSIADAFVIKFDNIGNLSWGTLYGGSGTELISGWDVMQLDACGNVYFSFATQSANITTLNPAGNCNHFDGTYGGFGSGSGQFGDCFLTYFDNTGNLLLATYYGGVEPDYIPAMAIDDSNNVYVSAMHDNYANSASLPMLDPGGGTYYDDTPNGGRDNSILKFIQTVPVGLTQSQTNSTVCFPCDGALTANVVSCDFPPYSYVWSNGSTTLNSMVATNTINGVCAGDYWVAVTSNCLITDTLFYTITEPLPSNGVDVASICQGDSILLGGFFQNSAGAYNDTLVGGAFNGCDSVVTTTLSILSLPTGSDIASICNGDSLFIGGAFQISAGAYNDTIVAGGINGCDSIVTTTLTIMPLPTNAVNASICTGDSLFIGGAFQNSAGAYNDTIVAGGVNGCDSIVTTTLALLPLPTSVVNISICQGDSVLLSGIYQNTSGTYNDTIVGGGVNGCDSLVSNVLVVDPIGDATINPIGPLCLVDAAILLSANQAGGVWSGNGITNSGTGEFDPSSAGVGIHEIIYTISGTCGDSDTIDIIVNDNPTIEINTVDDNCNQEIGQISVSVLTGSSPFNYSWDTGENTSSIIGLIEGTYTITVTDDVGCSIAQDVIVSDLSVDCQYHVFLANVFSPDGNGENEELFVQGKGIQSMNLKIYNRWGQLIFESISIDVAWDGTYKGKPVNAGVYVYLLDGSFDNGESFSEKGNVTVVK